MSTDVKKEPGQSSKTTRNTRKRTQATLSVFDVTDVEFPSHGTLFQISHKLDDDGKSVIWLENKTTHQQWQSTFEDIPKQGPKGVAIPAEVTITNLSAAIQAQSNGSTTIEDNAVDLHDDVDGAVQLVFTMQMSKSWSPKYCFTLQPVELSTIDLLKAQLKDTKEELASLKKQLAVPIYCSIGSQASFYSNTNIPWDSAARKHLDTSQFALQSPFQHVVVLKKGTYHIQALIGSSIKVTSANSVSLQVNGVTVANVARARTSEYTNEYDSFLVSDLCELKAYDTISVLWHGESAASVTDASKTRLTIQKLHI